MKALLIISLVLGSVGFALDFAIPEVSCRNAKYLVQVGHQSSNLFGKAYKFVKSPIGTGLYPQPITDLIKVKSVQPALIGGYRGENFQLRIWDATQEMPTGDPDIDDKCEICGVLDTVVRGKKLTIKGLECTFQNHE